MSATETTTSECKACRVSVRLAPGEVERILAEYLRDNPSPLADHPVYERRVRTCSQCPDLQYGTTCRHCGCLVAVRARIAGKTCPAPTDCWGPDRAP